MGRGDPTLPVCVFNLKKKKIYIYIYIYICPDYTCVVLDLLFMYSQTLYGGAVMNRNVMREDWVARYLHGQGYSEGSALKKRKIKKK